MLQELNTTAETADHLRVSYWTVAAWLSKGLLKKTKAGGRTLIAKKDVEAFLERSSERSA